jgi:hypothetical protein
VPNQQEKSPKQTPGKALPRRSEKEGSTSGNENYGATKKDGLEDGVSDPKR